MRSLSVLFLLSAILLSCTKRDNSSVNTPCSDSCTTVQGRFFTGNNEPIAGVSLEICSESRPTLGLGQTTIRKIATGRTDNNGFYSFTFSLKTGEYGAHNKYLFLKVDYDKARFVSIPWYDQFGTDEIIPVMGRRDTIVTMDYYFASKAQLRIQLNNFTPASTTDSFYILPFFHEVGYDKRHTTASQFFVATQVNNVKTIPIAGNNPNQISVVRKKDGIRTVIDTVIFTPTNQTTTLTLNY
jgi:hypothetical protein